MAGVAWSTTASAKDAAPIELTWEAPDSCPRLDAVLERVRRLAGRTREGAVPLQAQATVTETANQQLELRLVVRSGNLVGTRIIKGRSCSDLVGAVAVALALLLSSEEPMDERELAALPSDQSPPQPGEPSAEAPPPQRGQPEPSTEPPSEAKDGPAVVARSWRGLLTMPMLALSAGPQRRPLFGLAVGAGASFEGWHLHGEGKLWEPRYATNGLEPEYGARLQQLTLSLRGCRRVWGTRLELGPCVLVSLQHLSAQGTGPNIAPQRPRTTWVALGAGVRARYLVTPWLGLVAGMDVDVQLSHPEIRLAGVGSIERLSPFAATLALGSEWIL